MSEPREWWINLPDLDARNLNGGDYTVAHVAREALRAWKEEK